MSKFKVGDRVVNVEFDSGTVVKVRTFGDYVVKFDKPNVSFHDGDMGDGLEQYYFCNESDLSLENITTTDTISLTPKSLSTGFSFTLDIDNRMESGEYYITNELGVYKVSVTKVE